MNKLFTRLPLLLIIVISCKESAPIAKVEKEVEQVKTYIVEEELYNFRINNSGRITSEEELKLSFKTGGLIEKIFVKEGQKVNKGDVLAKLNLKEIKALSEKTRLAYEKSKRDFDRVQNLYKDSVATLEQFQNAETAFEYAQNNLEIANFNLSHSKITAPDNGIILKKLAEENEMVASGYPVILFGCHQKNWFVNTNVTDRQIVQLNPGDQAQVYTDAYPDTFLNAWVVEISQFADPYTGVFDVKLQLEPTSLKMVSGLITKNEIITNQSTKKLKIPYIALTNANANQAEVFKVKNQRAVKSEVQIFKILDDYVLLQSGIDKGDTLITEGIEGVQVNDSIKIVE